MRAVVRALKCLHPVASERGDPGDVIEAITGEYPYRYWLRAQRKRRGLSVGPTPHEVGIDCRCDPADIFEPDASQLIQDALDGGALAAVFHEDTAGDVGTVRIVATPGPVSTYARGGSSSAVLCRSAGAKQLGTAEPDLDWRHIERIDELLLHSGTRHRDASDGDRPPEAPSPAPQPLVTPSPTSRDIAVIVPSPASITLLDRLFEGLVAENCVAEVVVVDNSEPTGGSDDFYGSWATRLPLVVHHTDPHAEFNYSRANNLGARASVSPVLAFCNDDLEFIDHPTLSRLAGWLEVPDVCVAGPQLRYPDGTIQHGGVVLGLNGLAEHAFTGMTPGSHTLIGNTDDPRDVSAVTGACLVTSRDTFEAVGGFDEELVLTGSDVWFCLQAAELGCHTAYDGTVALVHHESVTRGATDHVADVMASSRRWGHLIDAGDPYWSQRLSVNRHAPTLRRRDDPTSRQLLTEHLRRHGVSDASVA